MGRWLACLAAIAVCLSASGVASAAPPPLEPITTERRIALDSFGPEGFDIRELQWAPDYRHLVVNAAVEGGAQVAVSRLDGRGFECLTCGLVPNAQKVLPLGDGRRIWFSSSESQGRDEIFVGPGIGVPLPGQGGTGDFQYYVLECAPSIYDCRQRQVLETEFPIDSLQEGAQNREAKPDPTGTYVTWNEVRATEGTRMTIAKLVRTETAYVLTEPRVFNPPYDLSGDPARWLPGSRIYEGAKWEAGNRYLKYQTTTTALNYDTWLLDIRTGERIQVTTDLDYNEIADYAPDARWGAISSARGLDRMDIFTQLVRPPFIDMVSFGQVGRIGLWNNRRCMNELWLWNRRYGQRLGGYSGQPIRFEDDWTVREFQWLPDGTRALAREELIPNHPEPKDPEKRVRYRIVRLPARKPLAPKPLHAVSDEEIARWSVPAAEYQGMATRQIIDRTINGPAGGTATLDYSGSFAAGRWEVTFDRWSEDGRSFVSGSESLATPNPIVEATWTADLTVEGAQNGFLRGTVHVGPQNRFVSDVSSEVDGRRYDKVPTQADCPGLEQPPLRLRVIRRKALDGDRVRLAVALRAVIAEDSRLRPVRRALVRAIPAADHRPSSRRARLRRGAFTNRHGIARLVVRRGKSYLLRGTAATFKPSELLLP